MTYKKLMYLLIALPVLLLLPWAYFISDGHWSNKAVIIMLILIVELVMALFIYFSKVKLKLNQLLFVTIVVTVVSGVSFIIGKTNYLYIPLLVGVMLIAMMIQVQLAIVMHLGMTLIIQLSLGQESIYVIYYLILGVVTAMIINYAKERKKMLVIVAGLSLFSAVLYGFLDYGINGDFNLINILIAMGNCALSIIVVVGSLPLWESIFKVMTPLKLLELANSDHKLMQRLLTEAPGTYHHVQMVGNLAERGAKAIGADGLLAKTGAVFHDIGKLKEPLYFIENQNGAHNPHDDIAAEASAKIIIEHVEFGVKIARDFKLPTSIVDIIEQHHGTSLVRYFYHKALNYKDGVAYEESDFRYSGPKPQTKEAVIVMLSDCVEAFVRSLSEEERTLEKIQWIVDEIIRQKFDDEQLDESPLQISELKIIGEAFMQVYNGLYHERISYPGKD